MNKWARRFLQVSAGAFFIFGAMFIPFGVWASGGQGSNPVLGWVIYLASILIPWSIGFWLARLGFRNQGNSREYAHLHIY